MVSGADTISQSAYLMPRPRSVCKPDGATYLVVNRVGQKKTDPLRSVSPLAPSIVSTFFPGYIAWSDWLY